MSRELRILSAQVDRPDERGIPVERRVGPAVCIVVEHSDLARRPISVIRLTDDQAIDLLAQLASSLNAKCKGERR